MALAVRWTFEASTQFGEILDYLEDNWAEKEIRNFFGKLDKGIITISTSPYLHKKSIRRKGTREYQVTSQVTIFYVVNDGIVVILLLWSNRMNPKNLL